MKKHDVNTRPVKEFPVGLVLLHMTDSTIYKHNVIVNERK